jgi:hypothetical protein
VPLKIFILSKRDVFLCLSLGNVSFRWRVLVVVKDDFHPLAAKIGIRHPSMSVIPGGRCCTALLLGGTTDFPLTGCSSVHTSAMG